MPKIEPITVYVKGNDGKERTEQLYIRENIRNICINFYSDDVNRAYTIKDGQLVGNKQFRVSEKEYQQLLALRNADNQRDLSLKDFSAAELKKEALKAMGFDYRDKSNCPDCQYYMGVEDEDSGLEIFVP